MLFSIRIKSLAYLIPFFTATIFNTNSVKITNEQLYRELMNLIKSQNVDKYLITNNGITKITKETKQNDREEHLKNEHKLIVKRLVPHALESKAVEYDEDLKTRYKPLVRIHRHPTTYTDILDELNKRLFDKLPYNSNKQDGNYIYDKGATLLSDRYLFPPLKNTGEKVTRDKILGDIQNYIKDKDSRKIRALKYAVLKLLEKHLNDRADLRSLVYVPPGMKINFTETRDNSDVYLEDPRPNWGTNSSFWTYWTYNKPVYEDKCKGRLVQWGNICIEPPPY